MADVDLTIGDSSGQPPTGNIVRLFSYWSGTNKIGEFPSSHPYEEGKKIKYIETLDGSGVHQQPINDNRERKMLWEYLDLDQYDVAGRFLYELKQRIYSLSGLSYYLGSTDLHGANFLPSNPIQIKIIDIETVPVPNSANLQIGHVTMRYHEV